MLKNLLIRLIIISSILLFCGCTSTGFDGETLINSIPKNCEKEFVDFYKCEINKSYLSKLFKPCKREECKKGDLENEI